ncbi:expression library immunization antigen 1 [Purpureocillium lavendulum]|uniref:Expression library immunization antigen 1 n=1 Tax=Purpureocillium lavendulum TaxID=1247861 RepID=A0AB34FWP2_9HYPO|nr:expression library immunization antigen 1 [Purpureocillium lavendulum]
MDMLSKTVLLALAAAQGAVAHFGIVYPSWRADTLADEENSTYSQWTYPCNIRRMDRALTSACARDETGAGVPFGKGNTTDWPLGGGSLKLSLHHPWTYVFVNLAVGDNATSFNVSLTPEFWNATGKGTLCVPKLPVPVNVTDGTKGSLQVVTLGASGSALYNCADIRFSKDAKQLDNCTDGGITVAPVKEQKNGTNGTDGASNSTAGGGGGKGSGAGALGVNAVAVGTVAGLASLFAVGLGL